MTLKSSEKAASEVMGHIIMLGLTVTGISLIMLVGVPSIYSLQDMANVRNAEQAFTVMDSRLSAVVLGNAPIQFLDINLGGGTFAVEPNGTGTESYIHVNIITDSGSELITIPMGKIRYHLGDRIVAYEGGGVWSKYPSGGSIMLSPPEFHYNGVTLTLPVINVSGGGSIGGSGSATLKFVKESGTIIVYPDASNSNRTNPVNSSGEGRVYVNITSEFYDAWADYAESLGYTTISKDETNSTVNIRLTVVPTTLGLNTSLTDPITFRGLGPGGETPLESWSFRVRLSDDKINWDLRATTGNKKLIFYLKDESLEVNDTVKLKVGYQDDGSGYGKPAETWETKDTNKIIVQEDSDGLYMDVNLLNTTRNLKYDSETIGAVGSCTPNKINSGDFNTSGGFSWEGETLNSSTEKSLYDLTQHYLWLLLQEGDPSFNNCGPHTPSGDSTMLVNYSATGALTYLHISENRADVDVI